MIREDGKLIQAVKDNAHLIAAVLSAANSTINEPGVSSYIKSCAKETAYEHIIELVTKH